VTTLLTAVKPVLNAAQRAETLRLAETTAGANGGSVFNPIQSVIKALRFKFAAS